MDDLVAAVNRLVEAQRQSTKPLAIVLAGHNGSGKSTMWYKHLAPLLKIPLINADRMMMSILPEVRRQSPLPEWARAIRDEDENWMLVAQQGVQAFVAHSLANKVPFAMETVFSHWRQKEDGTFESKIDSVREMQAAGYFVLLFFVGLASAELSLVRVDTRIKQGGHAVSPEKIDARFPRTQTAIAAALPVVDAAVLVDNSRAMKHAFTVCRVELSASKIYDCRDKQVVPPAVLEWLRKVAPQV